MNRIISSDLRSFFLSTRFLSLLIFLIIELGFFSNAWAQALAEVPNTSPPKITFSISASTAIDSGNCRYDSIITKSNDHLKPCLLRCNTGNPDLPAGTLSGLLRKEFDYFQNVEAPKAKNLAELEILLGKLQKRVVSITKPWKEAMASTDSLPPGTILNDCYDADMEAFKTIFRKVAETWLAHHGKYKSPDVPKHELYTYRCNNIKPMRLLTGEQTFLGYGLCTIAAGTDILKWKEKCVMENLAPVIRAVPELFAKDRNGEICVPLTRSRQKCLNIYKGLETACAFYAGTIFR